MYVTCRYPVLSFLGIKKESLEQILNKPSTVEQQNQKKHNELDQILDKQSWRETQLVQTVSRGPRYTFD